MKRRINLGVGRIAVAMVLIEADPGAVALMTVGGAALGDAEALMIGVDEGGLTIEADEGDLTIGADGEEEVGGEDLTGGGEEVTGAAGGLTEVDAETDIRGAETGEDSKREGLMTGKVLRGEKMPRIKK